jgi:hypothetical protein
MRDEYGFMSYKWHGIKTLKDFNGNGWRYSRLLVDIVDIPQRKKIGRITIGDAIRKFG